MHGEVGAHRIVARLLLLEERLAVLHVPFGEPLAVFLVLLVAVADRLAEIDREGRAAVFLVALVLVVAHHQQRIELRLVQGLGEAPGGGARLVLARHQLLRRRHGGELRIGLLQELRIGRRIALLVAVLDLLVGFQEARQRLVFGEQHRGVGRSDPEDDLGHLALSLEAFPVVRLEFGPVDGHCHHYIRWS